ncbi:YtfJ family protein [Aggregatibacter actinomycetemcomitans]|nr:YtfJ family protein [Aggregatibacter actinomycetemcomitans]
MKKITLALGFAFLSVFAYAHNLQINAILPNVAVQKEGELILNGKEISYKNWQSSDLTGKVRVIQHLAGRSSVKEKNEALMEAIKAQHFSPAVYQTTTIINADDAIFGTSSFVKSSAEKGKKQFPHSQIILDQTGQVKNAWQLQPQESLIVVLDKNGKVRFANEGKLSAQQIEQVIELVGELVK